MANKLILVPEQLYRGLTSNSPADLNLDFARRNLEKIKHSRKNLSAKNANYNQELRRYLNLRNEHENKPVKVEVVNGSKLLINKKTRQGIRAPSPVVDPFDDNSGTFNLPSNNTSRRSYSINGIDEESYIPIDVDEALGAPLPPSRLPGRTIQKRKYFGHNEDVRDGKRQRYQEARPGPRANQLRANQFRRRQAAQIADRLRRENQPDINREVGDALDAPLPAPSRITSRELQKRRVDGQASGNSEKKIKIEEITQTLTAKQRRIDQNKRRQAAQVAERIRRENQPDIPREIGDALEAPLPASVPSTSRQAQKRNVSSEDGVDSEDKKRKLEVKPQQQSRLDSEDVRVDRLYRMLNADQNKYRVRDDIILTRRGLPVSGSDLKETLKFMVRYDKGTSKRSQKGNVKPPPGTSYIRKYFEKEPELRSYLSSSPRLKFSNRERGEQRRAEQQLQRGTKKARFIPNLW
jgi:hypothetical protein